jgi:hypothetical protein
MNKKNKGNQEESQDLSIAFENAIEGDVKGLEIYLLEYESNRQNTLLFFDWIWYNYLFALIILLCFFAKWIYSFFINDYALSLSNLIEVFGIINAIIGTCLKLIKGPTDKTKLDIWLWKMGRLLYFVLFNIVVSFFLICFLNAENSNNLLFYNMFFLIHVIVVISILIKPKLITDRIFTSIGSIGILTWTVITIKRQILLVLNINELEYSSIIYDCIITTLLHNYLYYRSPNKINAVQIVVMKIMNPEKLLFEFQSILQKLGDSKEALMIISRLVKQKKYGVLNEINIEITKRFTPKNKPYYDLIILGIYSLIVFIILSVSEGIFQDAFKEIVEQKLCEWFGLLCNIKKD